MGMMVRRKEMDMRVMKGKMENMEIMKQMEMIMRAMKGMDMSMIIMRVMKKVPNMGMRIIKMK